MRDDESGAGMAAVGDRGGLADSGLDTGLFADLNASIGPRHAMMRSAADSDTLNSGVSWPW
ncbi:hypothetical protein ADL02_02690 [Streptomyces sp. NRRL WC-3723]|nr:hypothetical protein ADL02_02690 [Streptomyces sp. NRRL WC-3723]